MLNVLSSNKMKLYPLILDLACVAVSVALVLFVFLNRPLP